MIIAQHHIPGTPQYELSKMMKTHVDYTPTCDWPDDCYVQWGHGIVLAVPFFEAFPKETFIRGEGESIAEAEKKAFAQYKKEFECDHAWGRTRPNKRQTTYTNGAGWCRKCGAFRSNKFNPIFEIKRYRKPLSRDEYEYIKIEDPQLDAIMDAKYPEGIESRKKYKRILEIRLKLFGVEKYD